MDGQEFGKITVLTDGFSGIFLDLIFHKSKGN